MVPEKPRQERRPLGAPAAPGGDPQSRDRVPADLLIGGRYLDRYARREGQWRFAERAVVADWATVTNPSAVVLDHPLVAGSHIGRPGPDDPAYAFFRLLRRGERR